MRKKGPIFILFGCLFIVFIDSIEFFEGYFFLEFIEIEYLDLYNPLSILISPISNIVLSLLID